MKLLDRICLLALRAGASRPDHLYHADGTCFMRRWWILGRPGGEERFFALRLHYIATADLDPHLHDHPWPFVSIVLRGAYLEARPIKRTPCFLGDTEQTYEVRRSAGGLAFRRATDRHRIANVTPNGVWTLIFLGPLTHWWGFYMPHGKVYWKHYDSAKNERREATA